MGKWDEFERALKRRRRELLRHIAHLEEEIEDPLPEDEDERFAEIIEEEVQAELEEHELAELRRIDAALKRIAEGTYGICVECGAPIEPERLKALPDTPFCASCAAELQNARH